MVGAENNGLPTVEASGGGDSNDLCRSPIPNGQGHLSPTAQLIALSAVAIVLSSGIVAAVLLFIWLCFKYPDSANVIIPLMATTLIPAVIKLFSAVKAKKARALKAKDSPPQE